MTELIIMFIVFGWVSLMLTSSGKTVRKKGSVPRMKDPPPPPEKKCICNNVAKHSPGGRCEACWSKITKPKDFDEKMRKLRNESSLFTK